MPQRHTRVIPEIFKKVHCNDSNNLNWTVIIRVRGPAYLFKGFDDNLFLCYPNQMKWLDFFNLNGFNLISEDWMVDALRHRVDKEQRTLDTWVSELLLTYKQQQIGKAHVISLVERRYALRAHMISQSLLGRLPNVPTRNLRNRGSRNTDRNQGHLENFTIQPNMLPAPVYQYENDIPHLEETLPFQHQLQFVEEDDDDEVEVLLHITDQNVIYPEENYNHVIYQVETTYEHDMPPQPSPPQVNNVQATSFPTLRGLLTEPLFTERPVVETSVARYPPVHNQGRQQFPQFHPPPQFQLQHPSNSVSQSLVPSRMSRIPVTTTYFGEPQPSTSRRANDNLVFANLVPLQKKKMPPLVSIEELKRYLHVEGQANGNLGYREDTRNDPTGHNLYVGGTTAASVGEDDNNFHPEGVVGNLRRRMNPPRTVRVSPPLLAERGMNFTLPSFPPRSREVVRRNQNRGGVTGEGRMYPPIQEVGEEGYDAQGHGVDEEGQQAGSWPNTPSPASPLDFSVNGKHWNLLR